QQPPPPGTERTVVRCAVMDGKTMGHRICALNTCENPLHNFRTGRFCTDHVPLNDQCGIVGCGQAISLNTPDAETNTDLVDTFRAGRVYCLQTIQWSCGVPIGWGKCYRSESAPQVERILQKIWNGKEGLRPSFIVYDDGCGFLKYILGRLDPNKWLESTRFIVDAWHYSSHSPRDETCRVHCNPAPANGSQPDLVIPKVNENGQTLLTRAFNTETAEQFNAWLSGYEGIVRHMTDYHYDFFIHALFLMYKEAREKTNDTAEED
ncbi:hypothetical protein SISNIDRAFT_411721, partial [Sistotremastrum niveocremeum HHB9708]